MKKITPCLWFDKNAKDACDFYISVFPDSTINDIKYFDGNNPHGIEGEILTIEFSLLGNTFLAVNGGPYFQFTPAVSFMIPCENQEEINYYYDKLSFVEDAEQCGWIQDRFGVSWQLVPVNLDKYLFSSDKEKSENTMKVFLEMKRIDIDILEKTFNS
ncbi:MAG: VOC family protein [Candidatus Gracilibacteria bacterium]|nr:VOC family protein [Candidatus Gracilibacteria bacterium]